MAKPITDYVVAIRIKGEDRHPTATALARLIREHLQGHDYEVTVRAQVKIPETGTYKIEIS